MDALTKVCDVKGTGEFAAYRLSSEKLMAYLKLRVEATANELEAQKVPIRTGSSMAGYTRSAKLDVTPRRALVTYALGLLAEYLDPKLAAELFEQYGLKQESKTERDTAAASLQKAEARTVAQQAVGTGKPVEDYSKG